MVRLIGLLSEANIQPTGTQIVRYGATAFTTAAGSTLAINTGFHSVRQMFAQYAMKSPPNATALTVAGPEGIPTVGATGYILNIATAGGSVTIQWLAVGDN